MLLQKTPRLVIATVIFSVLILIVLIFDIPLGPEPEFTFLLVIPFCCAIICSAAFEDDKNIRAELDELRKLITPPETEEA